MIISTTNIYENQRAAFRASTSVKQVVVRKVAAFGLHDPDKYSDVYKMIPPFRKGDPIGRLFATGKAGHSMPLITRNALQVLPGISSFDTDFLVFLREFSREAGRHLPVDVDDEGFTSTGVHDTFDRLRCPAGYMQSPMSAKAVDNGKIREELGLTPGYSSDQRKLASAVWSLVWAKCRPSSVNVPPLSQGGMRRFTHDTQWKLDYANWKMRSHNYDRFLSHMERGDALGLCNDFEIVYGMYVQKRLQLDSPTKVRFANDWEYAITGGKTGERIPTDKRVVIEGKEWPDFSALRVRVIDAGPWSVNCDLQAVATSHMRALFELYPDTFHVNTAEEISRVIDHKHVYCSDVSEYDQSMSADALATVFSTMREYYPEGICRSAERLYQAPYFARPLALGGTRSRWIHDPLDWSFSMNSGNRSGHAFTSLVAKVNKVIDTLFVIGKIYPVNAGNVESYLLGRMPMGLVNNGDDEIIWAVSRGDILRYRSLRSDPKAGHYSVTPEVGQAFSGLLLVRPDASVPLYRPQARLQTAFEKMYVPERGIATRMRPYWPIGFREREKNLRTSDAGRELWEIHKSCFSRLLEPRYGSYNALIEQGFRNMDSIGGGLSAADLDVLIDPDKLHYVYHEDEISEQVLRKVTSRIPKEFVEGFLKRYYKGVFI